MSLHKNIIQLLINTRHKQRPLSISSYHHLPVIASKWARGNRNIQPIMGTKPREQEHIQQRSMKIAVTTTTTCLDEKAPTDLGDHT